MKQIIVLAAIFLMLVPSAMAKDDPPAQPIAWGMLSQNSGCVIFAEGHKTSGMFWGVAVTMKQQGKLTVIETQNYTMDQQVILETQANMDSLTQRAEKDLIKFVKIPEKYPPALLDQARAVCRQGQ